MIRTGLRTTYYVLLLTTFATLSARAECRVKLKSSRLDLGEPTVFVISGSGGATWAGETHKWIADNRPDELHFTPDHGMVRGTVEKVSVRGDETEVTLVYRVRPDVCTQEAGHFFTRPGFISQTFQFSGPAACAPEIKIPVTYTDSYQQKLREDLLN